MGLPITKTSASLTCDAVYTVRSLRDKIRSLKCVTLLALNIDKGFIWLCSCKHDTNSFAVQKEHNNIRIQVVSKLMA